MKNKPYPYYQWDEVENIYHLLELGAKKYGSKDAYVFKRGKNLCHKSFLDVHGQAHALASYFQAKGFTRQTIAILGENSYEWIVAWFGIVLSGNIAVPIDKLLDKEQIEFILNDTKCAAVVCSKHYSKMISLPLQQLYFEELGNYIEQHNQALVLNHTGKNETALIIYTSGTTGIAKGVALTQDNLCFDMNALNKIAYFPGNNLFVLPLNHVYAWQAVMVFLCQGLTTYISAGLTRIAKEMVDFAPYAMCVVPLLLETMHGKVIDSARKQGKEKMLKRMMKISLGLYAIGIDVRRRLFKRILTNFGGNLSTVICGGAPLGKEYTRAFRAMGITVMEGYGITECSPVLTGNRKHHYKDGSVGCPIPGCEIKTDAPDGKSEGELLVRGRMVMHSYFNNEQATREAFADGWYKTGDIGLIDQDNFVFITGRKKNIIILSNGKNLYPEELELALLKFPAIGEVVVFEQDRQVAAEIFPAGKQSDAEAAVTQLNKQLPPYKNISKIIFRETEFPKTSTKKIKR